MRVPVTTSHQKDEIQNTDASDAMTTEHFVPSTHCPIQKITFFIVYKLFAPRFPEQKNQLPDEGFSRVIVDEFRRTDFSRRVAQTFFACAEKGFEPCRWTTVAERVSGAHSWQLAIFMAERDTSLMVPSLKAMNLVDVTRGRKCVEACVREP